MAPKIIDASEYSADTLEFIRCLNSLEVRYLIVGGEAVIFHGYPRFTEDIDFFYSRDSENSKNLYAALARFWEDDIPAIEKKEDLMEVGTIIQFGRKPNRIDLLNQIDGVTFEECWEARQEAFLECVSGEKIPVHFIGLVALIKNKRASGRHKDLGDVEYLQPESEQEN